MSGLLGDVAYVHQARSRCLRCCPGVTVVALDRPSHRARGGHDLLIRRFLYRRPDPFRAVHDLGLVSSGCPGGSGAPKGCSCPWLPAWLPADDSVTPWSSSPSPDLFPAIWPRPVLSAGPVILRATWHAAPPAPASRSSHRWSSSLAVLAPRGPGRGRRRPPQARPSSSATTSTVERALLSPAVELRCWTRPTTTCCLSCAG